MKRKLSYTLRGPAGDQEVGPKVTSVHVNDAEHLLGLHLVVNERDNCSPEKRYFACFDGVEIIHGSLRVSACGNGKTPQAAIKSYISCVSGAHCVTGGYSKPHYFTMPNLHI